VGVGTGGMFFLGSLICDTGANFGSRREIGTAEELKVIEYAVPERTLLADKPRA